MIEANPHGNLPPLDDILQIDLTEYQPRGGTMSFVGSPSMPEGPTREPDLEVAIRAGKRVLRDVRQDGQPPSKAEAGQLEHALQALVAACEADDRIFPRLRPVR